MEQFIDLITSNKIIILALIISAIIIVISIVKQVFKILFLVTVLVILYAGYLLYSGQGIPTTVDGAVTQIKKSKDSINLKVIDDKIIQKK